jgi:hypothetical protein
MLTLSQIEPRTPISSAPITITQPGSYYLATNLTVSGGTAIVIQANGVTLDLRGFTISSTAATAAGMAILLNGSVTNIAIYDGQIMSGVTNSSTGIFGGSGFVNGISAATPYNVRVKNISVCGVMNYGIFLGANSSVAESCVVNVAGNYGIFALTVSDSSVNNAGETGIYCYTANNCYAVTGTGGSGIYALSSAQNCYGYCDSPGAGIYTSQTQNCYGYNTGSGEGIETVTAESCWGRSATGDGILATTAENCFGESTSSSTSNTGDGISTVNAENCYGEAFGEGDGINATAVANACTGYSALGPGIAAFIANVCHGTGGTGSNFSVTHGFDSY